MATRTPAMRKREIGHPCSGFLQRQSPARPVPCIGPGNHAAEGEGGEGMVLDFELAGGGAFEQQVRQQVVEFPAQRVDLGEGFGREVLFLAEVDGDVGLALQHDLGEVGDGDPQPFRRRAWPGGGVGDGCQRKLDGWLAQRCQQLDLAAKMGINERFGDAEFGGNVVQRGAGEASLVEQFDCFFEDALALVGQNFISHVSILRRNGLD